MAKNLVIVESPAKAKTINKYLGNDYKVLASYGHVRDLTAKDGSVDPDDGFAMKWEVSGRASKTLKELTTELKEAEAVYLATDPDREGEAISWHLQEYFKEKKLLKDKQVFRVTFNEITKAAVNKAFEKPRDLDDPLIQAYLARRALDYLVGFNISPVLWRKLPGSKSAGRVQSVALRLICEREFEIEEFKAQEYWSIAATLLTPEGAPFSARLTHLAGNKLGKMDIGSEEQAKAAVARIENKALKIQKIEKKQVRRNPYAPFI
ncbi:MAG: DNA topoisomerase, partial [Pseudomonadota bacterium]|nr:DNA topoisomerase [Pseudomonadota bacterium]